MGNRALTDKKLIKGLGSWFQINFPSVQYLSCCKMCRGIQEANPAGSCFKESASFNENTAGFVSCELCGSRASLYCQADDAFLCRKCDKWVHEANFLAHRHVRCFLCNTCQNLTHRYLTGASPEALVPAMVSLVKRRQCDSKVERKCSRKLKRPFQFL